MNNELYKIEDKSSYNIEVNYVPESNYFGIAKNDIEVLSFNTKDINQKNEVYNVPKRTEAIPKKNKLAELKYTSTVVSLVRMEEREYFYLISFSILCFFNISMVIFAIASFKSYLGEIDFYSDLVYFSPEFLITFILLTLSIGSLLLSTNMYMIVNEAINKKTIFTSIKNRYYSGAILGAFSSSFGVIAGISCIILATEESEDILDFKRVIYFYIAEIFNLICIPVNSVTAHRIYAYCSSDVKRENQIESSIDNTNAKLH